MKLLEEMSIGERIALTIVIVLVILFAMALAGWLTGGWDQVSSEDGPLFEVQSDTYKKYTLTQEPLYPDDIPLDGKLLALDKRALDEAYHQQLLLLWSVFLKEGGKDSSRMNNGLRIARSAYAVAQERIEAREKELTAKQ